MTDKIGFNIGICQFNATVGDIEGNRKKIINYIKDAEMKKVDILIFPELSLVGYSPMDLLYYSSITSKISKNIGLIIQSIRSEMNVIFGTAIPLNDVIQRSQQRYLNSALIVNKRGIQTQINKVLLPNYGIFNEKRHFVGVNIEDNENYGVFEFRGHKLGIQICEDMWSHIPMYHIGQYKNQKVNVTSELVKHGAEIIINISASPFTRGKAEERLQIIKSHCSNFEVPFIYANMVGGLDEVVFDGRSLVVNAESELVHVIPPYVEELSIFNSDQLFNVNGIEDELLKQYKFEEEREIIEAIKLNLKDYLNKINFDGKLLVALSGGIDSALTAALATMAIGKERIIGVNLPSEISSSHSKQDAKKLAENLGIDYLSFSIKDIKKQFMGTIQSVMGDNFGEGLAEENIQARIRGTLMMFLSNAQNRLMLSTGNKSEIAVGYCTLYGDTNGGKNLIGDLYKTDVYNVAKYINNNYQEYKIPESTITKEPSAELREDQFDEDTLPEYDTLDKILQMLIELNLSSQEIISFGYEKHIVEEIAQLVRKSEFKRAQMVQTVILSENAFGMGRIIPIGTSFSV